MKGKLSKPTSDKPKKPKRNIIYLIATILSRALDPFVTVGGASVVAVLRSGLYGLPLFIFLFGIVVTTIIFLIILLHWAVRKGHLSNWDLSNRKERILPLFILMGVLMVDVVIARFFINDFLVDLFVLYIFWIIGFFLITLFWKISGHAAGAALGAGLIIQWYGWSYWPLFLIIPIVMVARLLRKDHTLLQLIAGALYSFGILNFVK